MAAMAYCASIFSNGLKIGTMAAAKSGCLVKALSAWWPQLKYQ